MADRLQMKGHAYDAEGRIYLPWAGAEGYAPPQRSHGRRSPCDIQLWGPHWVGGPVGPSATLVQWAAIHEHANGPADWIFGYNAQATMRLQAVAQAMSGQPAATTVRRSLRKAPDRLHTRSTRWEGRAGRWSALQCKHALVPAQSRYAMRMSQAARLARMPADHPPDPGHLSMVKYAEAALEDCDWREANRLLLRLCETVTRMQTGQVGPRIAPSRQTRTRIIALLDALGL
jgi:hypothetical protein